MIDAILYLSAAVLVILAWYPRPKCYAEKMGDALMRWIDRRIK